MTFLTLMLVRNGESVHKAQTPGIGPPAPKFNVLDEIQASMNGGYSIGAVRVLDNGSYELRDVSSDGATVSFNRCGKENRPESWKPSSILERYLKLGEERSYDAFKGIARKHGYIVELAI